MDEVNMDEVNMDEVNMDEVNVDEVNVDEVNVNEVNEESAMNEDSGEVCDVKEEMSKGKSLEIEAKVEVKEKSEEEVTAKPPDVLQRFDFTAKVQVEELGMEEVKNSQEDKKVERLPPSQEAEEESRHVNWDPGELIDTKAQVEILDAKEVEILVKDDNKVGLRLFNVKVEVMQRRDVTTKALLSAMMLYNFVRLYISEVLVLVALNVARFVIVNQMSSRTFAESFLPILSDYG